jgi:hypothetical protein
MKNRFNKGKIPYRANAEIETAVQTFNGEETSTVHLAHLEKHWEIIAAISWKEFSATGRGALVFHMNLESNDWDCVYLSLRLLEGHPLMEGYVDLVRKYVPTKDVVAIFLVPPATAHAYCGSLNAGTYGST